MNKRFAIIVAVFLSAFALAQPQAETRRAAPNLLPEGFVLRGIDGNLNRASQEWFFEISEDVGTDRNTLKAGTRLEILPSAVLENMVTDANDRSTASYKLWGKIMKYKGENFIFPVYFLPLSNILESEQTTTKDQELNRVELSTVGDPNDELAIPPEVLTKLESGRNVRYQSPAKRKKTAKRNSVLADRTGFIVEAPDRQDDLKEQVSFIFDGLGRNLSCERFKLLPCAVLERIEQLQAAEPDPIRFKVAGIVTEYEGAEYLLLHRAVRAYNHGNFVK